MQISVLQGTSTDRQSDYRVEYPVNMVPVALKQGVSAGYLAPTEGIEYLAGTPGADRGARNWLGVCYRVSGERLIRILSDNTVEDLGRIPGSGYVTLHNSFDYLSISGGSGLYLYNDADGLQQVTDVDLGVVTDHRFVDGYFLTTDGEFIVATELNDPFSVNPIKFGSSEVDPDPVVALLSVRNEPHAVNRYTIEAFENIGGTGFPFRRIEGAQIQRGAVGTHTCCVFLEAMAFVGSGRNESLSVWLGRSGQSTKISTREVDLILEGYTEEQLSQQRIEPRTSSGLQQLWIHLQDHTLVYDATSSAEFGKPVWYVLQTSLDPWAPSRYLAIHPVWCYSKWIVGDPSGSRVGQLVKEQAHHWGSAVAWGFTTEIAFNGGKGLQFHDMELFALTGRVDHGKAPSLYTQYSLDGETWSQRKYIKSGTNGQTKKRLVWIGQGSMRTMRIQRFSGTSETRLSVARLEARTEPLGV